MFELTIDGKVYPFKFGVGFVREIDKKVSKAIDGLPDKKQNMGLQFAVAAVIDKDPVELVNILDLANKTEKPRVTRDQLDSYIDDESTDFDQLCEEVLDFLKSSNATRKTTLAVLKEVEKAKTAQE